ncbi:hypothetical protein [Pseudooctadecabacter sp.]|uniref:hypothetical protein n=1 Tax=Pseudooctadecabacter sp. TaxID=1966338 RepID=UPI0035C7B617
MVRPFSFLNTFLVVLMLSVIASVVPSETQAHVAVHEVAETVPHLDVDEPEPHCHGEIECVVTLFPATFETWTAMSYSPSAHIVVRDTQPVGAALQQDPPVPIAS